MRFRMHRFRLRKHACRRKRAHSRKRRHVHAYRCSRRRFLRHIRRRRHGHAHPRRPFPQSNRTLHCAHGRRKFRDPLRDRRNFRCRRRDRRGNARRSPKANMRAAERSSPTNKRLEQPFVADRNPTPSVVAGAWFFAVRCSLCGTHSPSVLCAPVVDDPHLDNCVRYMTVK